MYKSILERDAQDERAALGIVQSYIYLKDGEAELGYSMLPKFWGFGYGTEMATRMVELAKATTVVKRLVAIVDPKHKASIRILTNLGLTLSEITTWENLPAHFYRLEL